MIYNRIFFFTILFVTLNLFPIESSAQSTDNSAVNSLIEGLGDTAGDVRYLIFSYGSDDSESSYLYDWENGDCRFEAKTKGSKTLVVLFNTNTSGGQVFVDEKPVTDERTLKEVQQSFKDDSYFLFTPILIANQEIKAVEQQSEIVDSKKFHVLKVTNPHSKYKSSEIYVDIQKGTIYKWNTYDSNNKLSHELIVSKIKDIGGGLILPTQFNDKLTGKSFGYPVAAALLNVEPKKFKEP